MYGPLIYFEVPHIKAYLHGDDGEQSPDVILCTLLSALMRLFKGLYLRENWLTMQIRTMVKDYMELNPEEKKIALSK